MAEFPAMPFWTDAWIADTKHLARCERGMYFDLLVLMWRTPGCKVPKDLPWLARRLDIREKDETEMLSRILSEFCISDGNRIWQKRALKEYEYCRSQSVRRKGKKNNGKSANQDACPDPAPIPTPTPIPTTVGSPYGDPRPEPPSATVIDLEAEKVRREAMPQKPKRVRKPAKVPARLANAPARISPQWSPTKGEEEYAVGLGLIPALVADAFRDYWLNRAGPKGSKLDWSATWRTWCRREADEQRTRAVQPPNTANPIPAIGGRSGPPVDGFYAALAAIRARAEGD